MRKRYIACIVVASIFCLGLWWQVKAQNVSVQEMSLIERIATLESKLDTLRVSQENAQKEISGKLDRVLSNQGEILKQLEIVKVRATRK